MAVQADQGPLGLQIQDQLRAAIRDGRLAAGERLPSSRRLAERLGVARGTVVDVYAQLWAEGYVESAVGSGTRVADLRHAERMSTPPVGVTAAPASCPDVDFEYGTPTSDRCR